jgi:hypothetical protein
MYDVEATVTETAPTLLRLSADWPVDWLRETGIRTVEIQRELLHSEFLELPWVPTERAEIRGNRSNWRKLHVGLRVVVRCFFPDEILSTGVNRAERDPLRSSPQSAFSLSFSRSRRR